jgi:hypothetical protein
MSQQSRWQNGLQDCCVLSSTSQIWTCELTSFGQFSAYRTIAVFEDTCILQGVMQQLLSGTTAGHTC